MKRERQERSAAFMTKVARTLASGYILLNKDLADELEQDGFARRSVGHFAGQMNSGYFGTLTFTDRQGKAFKVDPARVEFRGGQSSRCVGYYDRRLRGEVDFYEAMLRVGAREVITYD